MANKTTQSNQILEYMRQGNSITPLEALNLFGCMRLGARITQTALKGIEREANSAGLSLEQALTICCERGWRGFRAEWLHSDRGNHPPQPKPNRINTVPQHTNGGAHLAKDIL